MHQAIPVQRIYECWFADCIVNPEQLPAVSTRWYQTDANFDQMLKHEFGSALVVAAEGHDWNQPDMQARLARVLLLDQFSRNIYRGSARAFACDPLALKLCLDALDTGQDKQLAPIERAFLAMPLQHAEDPAIQRRSVRYFSSLVSLARHPLELNCLASNADYARQHADIIQRFGRYPHRNEVLGRPHTAREEAYLNDGAPRFGQ